MKRLSWAIIGAGQIAGGFDNPGDDRILTHIKALKKSPYVDKENISVVEPDDKKRKAFCKKWQIEKSYPDAGKLLKDGVPDAVSICTPPASRKEIIGKICAAGAGLILCEKPLAPSYIEALSIARLCRKSKTRLVVNYPRQFDPVHRKAVELVKSGRLGKIRVVSGYYTKGLFNNGSHFINLLRAFFGNISGVKNLGGVFAKDAPYESPDFMTTHRGVKCLMRALDHRDYMLFELDIVGQKGRIRLIEKGNKIELYATDNDPIYKGYRALRLKKVFSGTFDKMMLSVIYAAAKGCFRKDDRWDIMAKEAAEDISLIEKILKEQSG